MLRSVDPFLSRRYERGVYDCLAFAREVWKAETGEDLGGRLDGLLDPATRHPERRHLRAFRPLARRESPCLVLMERPRSSAHVGVYLRGSVLHLSESGAAFVPLEIAQLGFSRVRFFR